MNRTENRDWTFKNDGSTEFLTMEGVLRSRHKAENSISLKKILLIGAIVCCSLIDIIIIYQLFTPLIDGNILYRIIASSGLFIGFDVAPVILGSDIKRAKSGYRIHKIVSALMIVAFAIALIVNLDLRMATKDSAVDNATSENLMVDYDEEEKPAESDPVTEAMARTLALFPIITSLVSFGASFSLSDPMRKELNEMEKEIERLEQDINHTKSVLEEFNDEFTLDELMKKDKELLDEAINNSLVTGKTYFDYVRECLMPLVESASGVNLLAMDCENDFLELMNSNSNPALALVEGNSDPDRESSIEVKTGPELASSCEEVLV